MVFPFHVFDMLIFGPAKMVVVVTNGDELEERSPRARGTNLSIGIYRNGYKIVSSQKGSLKRDGR